MQYQNALQKYFDGELDDVGEDMLFGELAHNHDARREFNEHTKLRAAMQQERSAIIPPAHAAGAIFGALGYDLATTVPPTSQVLTTGKAAAVMGLFLKFMPYAVTSVLSAIVAVVLYAEFTERALTMKQLSNNKLTEKAFKNEQTVVAEKQNGSLDNSLHPIQNLLNNSENSLERNFKSTSANNREYSAKRQGSNTKQNLNDESLEVPASKVLNQQNSFKNKITVIASGDFKNNVDFSSVELRKSFSSDFPGTIIFEDQKFLKTTEELPKYSFEYRLISAKSFPENSVAAQSNDFKNMAVTGLYQLSENHAIGAEIGREQFAQEYEKVVNGQVWGILQNPVFWYGCGAYRFTISETDLFGFKNTFIPFGQIVAGAAQTGMIGKSQIGFKIVPMDHVALILAAEGSILRYEVDGKWSNSQKLGVTYGVQGNF